MGDHDPLSAVLMALRVIYPHFALLAFDAKCSQITRSAPSVAECRGVVVRRSYPQIWCDYVSLGQPTGLS